MKRILSALLVTLTLASTATLFSCSQADIDITHKNNVYSDLSDWINNSDIYAGKTVALNATYTVVYNFSENKIARHTLLAYDTTGVKRALYEVRKSDGAYPEIGSEVTVIGTLTKDRYIAVESFSGSPSTLTVDIDALTLSAAELHTFIESYRNEYSNSEHYGKSVSIFGHLTGNDTNHFLIGLDGDGKYIWEIELYDPTGRAYFPQAAGNTVNPVQIIGELTTFVDDNVTYACIKVDRVIPVESVFKIDNDNN